MSEIRTPSKGEMVVALPQPDAPTVISIRGERVVLDADLAALFEVETRVFNQAFKRNQDSFPESWAFKLTQAEFGHLKSQSVISSDTWGGRRTPPWAFTEHGVVLAASLLRSDRAKAVMQMVVDVFVRARRGEFGKAVLGPKDTTVLTSGGQFSRRLQSMIERLMDSIVSEENQKAVRDEAQAVFRESIDHIRSKLGRAGFENEEIAARATKLLAEAEATKATAIKTRAEADEIALRTIAKKLEMVLQAELAISRGEMAGFFKVLKKLGKV